MFYPDCLSYTSASDDSLSDDNLSDLENSSSKDDSDENDIVSVDSVRGLSGNELLSKDNPPSAPSTKIEQPDNIRGKISDEDVFTETFILEKNIQDFFKKSNTYVFRSTEIDGIYCSCILYRDEKIVSVESTRVIVITNDNKIENYSLHYEYYDSILHAIGIVNAIVKTYKLYNGDLYSPEDYAYLLAEEKIVPFLETERCSVCNINTTDMTTCNHYICFRCRENALRDGIRSCISCNTLNVLHIYHSKNISNNQKYNDIDYALKLSDTNINTNINTNSIDNEMDNTYLPEHLVATELYDFIKNNRESIDNAINVVSSFMNVYKRWFLITPDNKTSDL
jgi:hypothetical protein